MDSERMPWEPYRFVMMDNKSMPSYEVASQGFNSEAEAAEVATELIYNMMEG